MAQLGDRQYFDVAVFWAPLPGDQLIPRNATQHGRLYPASGALPPAIAVTQPDLLPVLKHTAAPNEEIDVVPVPPDLNGFPNVWTLGPEDIAALKRLAVPGV